MKKTFEVDWPGGEITSQLVRDLLGEYLLKLGHAEVALPGVVAVEQLAETDDAGRLREAAKAVVAHSTPLMDGTLIARKRAAREALVNLRAALGIAV